MWAEILPFLDPKARLLYRVARRSERMSAPAISSKASADPVVWAIGRAGITGITAKQLAEVTELSPDHVSDRLGALSSRKEIARIGRGLWVLDRFAVVGPAESEFRGPAWYDRAFARQFKLRIGRRDGEIQFNPNEKRPVHRWWPYVQGFSAGFVGHMPSVRGTSRFHCLRSILRERDSSRYSTDGRG